MINVKRFICNMIQENCYVVSDETKECVIIDCGAFYEEERNAICMHIHREKLIPKQLLCTHGHIDHNFGNNTVFEKWGLQPQVATEDEFLMNTLQEQAKAFVGINLDYNMPHVGRYITSQDTIKFGNHTFCIIATPGHTPGSVVYYCEKEHIAFTGDTLFHMSIGRTDFEGGSIEQMEKSLKKLSKLPAETIIMPGHGEKTSMDVELKNNLYLR